MQLIMNNEKLNTVEQVKRFLEGNEALEFGRVSIEGRYQWIERVLLRFRYFQFNRAEKGEGSSVQSRGRGHPVRNRRFCGKDIEVLSGAGSGKHAGRLSFCYQGLPFR